ncbi:MAG TPA: PQQ-binding-like beta-propeller repeat protein [Candidatus Binatia bacterium]|jgi:hypothetical protein|nr:PQQ-binding-like beta-propeller repeat protein [Candidatus Binatia bacterium]
MKIQCSCGAKYEFEITPEMMARPVRFICPACGVDASEFVDSLVRQELGQTATPSGALVDVAPGRSRAVMAAAPAGVLLEAEPAPAPARPAVRMVTRNAEAAPAGASQAPPPLDTPQPCLKHLGELATEKCFVCSKPICPKCMELFGYVCSPLCKAKADSHGIEVPVYEGQRSVVEARQWRIIVRVTTTVCLITLVLLSVRGWYAWSGSRPKPIFSVRFDEPAYSGQAVICGKDKDQIVFLHGDTLARHDMKTKKEVWSCRLLDRKKIAEDVQKEIKDMEQANLRMGDNGVSHPPPIPPADKLQREMERAAAADLTLHVSGQSVWVSTPEKLVRYDWETGKSIKELAIPQRKGELISHGEELLLVDAEPGRPSLTHINLSSCEVRTEDLSGGAAADLAEAGKAGVLGTGSGRRSADLAGLPMGMPGKDLGKPMDPAKVAEQAQHLSLPARLALPATLSANLSQERALTELDDTSRPQNGSGRASVRLTLLPSKDGFVEVAVRLVESRMVQVSAMKAPPSKSVLNGNLTAGNTLEAANEILNEMQRSRGGDMVEEDQSRYQVTLRRLGAPETWTGEVIGPPSFYPLQTVNVLAANKSIRVMDKTFKQLWQSPLNYNVEGRLSLDEENAIYGQGPCVEHKGTLYVFDEGVLTAFNLATGTARWRLVSVGITGIFFDDKDMIYVNTTSASPDSIKYSRQIDVSQRAGSVIQKVDSKSGKVLWTAEPGGLVNYVNGKFIFTVQQYMPYESEDESPYTVETGLEARAYLRVRRINPKNGRQMWEYFQQRAPLDIAFDKNRIRLVFKKEVQVLRFLAF